MPKSPSSFSDKDYWEERFKNDSQPFDWLLPASCFDGPLTTALASVKSNINTRPHLLHIGCGTSLLSLHLRSHVDHPSQVHNVDFSPQAIALGQEHEKAMFGESEHQSISMHTSLMRWSTVDLLSASSTLGLIAPPNQKYDIVIDKSTSDAISCAEDVTIHQNNPVFKHLAVSGTASKTDESLEEAYILHPLELLAIHLALVTRPGSYWLCTSYSSTRFPFLEDGESTDVGIRSHGIPGVMDLWSLEAKVGVSIPNDGTDTSSVHRPEVKHWIYVLKRAGKP